MSKTYKTTDELIEILKSKNISISDKILLDIILKNIPTIQ